MAKKKWTHPRALKKGTLRLQGTKSCRGSGSSKNYPAYTPSSQKDPPEPRRAREKLTVTGEALRKLSSRKLLSHLQQLGHLPRLVKGGPCLYCGKPLSNKGCPPLPAILAGTGAKYFRCTTRPCNRQQHVLTASPVFGIGRGEDVLPLRTQVLLLWHTAWTTPLRQIRAELGINEKRIANMQSKWRSALAEYVQETQCKAQGGGYKEVEADECVVRKQFVENQVVWQGWVGSKERGVKRSLVLEKRPFERSLSQRKKTGFSCPPPLSSEEWTSYCRKHVASQTILHVDGAQAYATQVDDKDIRRDTVSHSTKKGGPFFVKACSHKKVNGRTKKTCAGTQAMDGFWQHLKRSCHGVNARYPDKCDDHIRESQWHSWLGSEAWTPLSVASSAAVEQGAAPSLAVEQSAVEQGEQGSAASGAVEQSAVEQGAAPSGAVEQ
ncbi:unnamed protein product, partial [Symbiodinium microadriaticum]